VNVLIVGVDLMIGIVDLLKQNITIDIFDLSRIIKLIDTFYLVALNNSLIVLLIERPEVCQSMIDYQSRATQIF